MHEEMKFFPESLKVENKDRFKNLVHRRYRTYLRRALFEHIISHEETDYFAFDKFINTSRDMKPPTMEEVQKLVNELIPELEKLGWKCKKAYGDTALFIYSSSDPPQNCW